MMTKQLELELNKRLLIVEVPEHADMDCPFEILPNKGSKYLVFSQYKGNIISRYKLPDGNWKLICKGSELTEDIAKDLVPALWNGYKNYSENEPVGNYKRLIVDTALKSLISVIKAEGFHWGLNPVEQPFHSNFDDENDFYSDLTYWKEAESKTFNPEKCIICEIL